MSRFVSLKASSRLLNRRATVLTTASTMRRMASTYPTSHAKIENPGKTQGYVNNEYIDSGASKWIDLHDPATNNLVTRVPQSTPEELTAAVDAAEEAFKTFKNSSILSRQQIAFNFVKLIRENWDRLAASITLEQGKTLPDARATFCVVFRSLKLPATSLRIFLVNSWRSPRTWKLKCTVNHWVLSRPFAHSTSQQ